MRASRARCQWSLGPSLPQAGASASSRVKMETAKVTAAGTAHAIRSDNGTERSYCAGKSDTEGNRFVPGPIAGAVASQTVSRPWPTAGLCWRVHAADRRSHRLRRAVGVPAASSQLCWRRPGRYLTAGRRGGMGSTYTPRPQPRRRRPGLSVMPVRELLYGRARIGLRGHVRRNHVERAHPAIFRRQRARFRLLSGRWLLHGRSRARLIHLCVQWQHVEFWSSRRRCWSELPHGHGFDIVLVTELLRRGR